MSVFFMRHGDTYVDGQKDMTVAEASKKISLSELGKSQCRKVILPKDLDLIVISDSRRTKESAKLILKANKMSIPIKVEKKLHPWDAGTDDWNEYWKRFEDFILRYDPRAGYESKKSLIKRVSSVLKKYSGKNILVIAHSILLATYLGEDGLPCAKLIQVE